MMKEKKQFIKIVVPLMCILLFVVSIVGYDEHKSYKKKETKRLEQGHAKRLIMFAINEEHMYEYKGPEYNDELWDKFLEDKYTARCLGYINAYMAETYPDSPYTDMSVGKLEKDYLQVYYIWYRKMSDYLKHKEDGKDTLTEVFDRGVLSGLEKDTINLLGYGHLTTQYDYYITYDDVFLIEKNLQLFLERLNQYMKQEYPDISYEDFTVTKLDERLYSTCDQLWEITEELDNRGVEFSKIVEQLHLEVNAANP